MRTVSNANGFGGSCGCAIAGTGTPSAWPEKISSPLLFFEPP